MGLTPNNLGNVGGGLYFDMTINTTITLTSLDMWHGNNTAVGSSASWELWLGPSTYLNNVTNAGLWTLVGTTTPVVTTQAAYVLLTGLTINPVPQIASVTLAPGNYGFAFRAVGCSNGYTNGVTCTSTTIPGACANTTASTAELTLRAGAAQNAFLTGPVFTPRAFSGNIHYTNGGTPITFGARQPYGPGCYSRYRTFYELWPSSVFVDLSNTSLYLTYNGGNFYTATAGVTPVAPSASPSLGHTDESVIVVNLGGGQPIIYPDIGGPGIALTTVEMSSNGFVTLNGTNPSGTLVDVAAFLTGSPRIGNWHDMDPGAGGTTHYDYDAGTQSHVFTWANVPDFNIAGSSNTFQMAFFANGDVELRWGLMSQLGGGGWPTLVGFTPGVTSADPGSIDISAGPFATNAIDQVPLALAADANPVINTTINLTTTNDTNPNVGITFLALNDLGVLSPAGLDLGFIGAGGCVANVDINTGANFVISNLGLPFPSMTVPFAIPNLVLLVGLNIYGQSIFLDPAANAFGMLTSNGLRLRIGSF
jgi:hypothetical protein